MDIFELIFRNESVFMVKNDITGLTEVDWFLKILINWDDESKKIHINEDKDTAMSIIETLADKWCLPETIIQLINDRIQVTNHQTKKEFSLIDDMVFKCLNCGTGFKMNENYKDSCVCHPDRFDINGIQSRFRCCGGDENSKPCVTGYHTLCSNDREKYLSLKMNNESYEEVN